MPDRLINLSRVSHVRRGRHTVFGEAFYTPGGICGPRIQRDFQLVVLVSGRAAAVVAGQPRPFRAGEVALMLPGEPELVNYTPDAVTHHTWCAVSPDGVPELLAAELRRAPSVLPASDTFRRLMDTALANPHYRGSAASALADRLGLTVLHSFLHMAEEAQERVRPTSPTQRALDFMETHLADADCLAAASVAARVSPQHLRRCFRTDLGSTPSHWLWRLRIERALGMLLYSGMTLTEIAQRCGFASVYHFSRVFKQHHGQPPGRYRRSHWLPREAGAVPQVRYEEAHAGASCG